MTPAIELYRSLGFRPIPAYRFNPIPGAVYFEAEL
jgi:ribosomal protein S18 acetylase RimI-like enzyme